MLWTTPLSVFIIPSTSLSSLENRPFLYHVNLSFQPHGEVSALFYCTVPIFSAHLVLWGWFWCTLGLHRWGRCGVQGTVEAGAQIPGDCDCAGCCRNLWSLQNTFDLIFDISVRDVCLNNFLTIKMKDWLAEKTCWHCVGVLFRFQNNQSR